MFGRIKTFSNIALSNRKMNIQNTYQKLANGSQKNLGGVCILGNFSDNFRPAKLYSTLLYSTLLYSTLLYYTLLYYTILY